MDKELLKSMFLRARDHYESAVRWSFIFIVVCLSLHLMTFSQFVRFGKQLSDVQGEMQQFSEFNRTVADIKLKLEGLEKSMLTALDIRINNTLNSLMDDFEALDRTVAKFRKAEPSSTVPDDLSRLFSSSPVSSPLQAPVGDEKLFEFKADLEAQVTEAQDIRELREVLLPFIEEKIIQPRFDQLNNGWNKTVLPDIRKGANSLLKELQGNQPSSPEGKALWDDIRDSVEQTLTMAAALTFQPPEDDSYWWASATAKIGRLLDAKETAARLLKPVAGSEAVTKLSKEIEATLVRQKALQETLEQNLKRIEENFKEQQSQLASLGKPFQVISLDINILVSKFPLLLGIVLAAITIWPAYRLWELAWTADLMAKKGQEEVPWEWFRGKIWTLYSQAQDMGQGGQSRVWESFARCVIFWGWIAVAAWELNGWEELDFMRVTWFAIGGCIAVAAAHGYRIYTIRRVLSLREHS